MKTPGGGGYGKCYTCGDFSEIKPATNTKFVERGSVFDYRQSQESV